MHLCKDINATKGNLMPQKVLCPCNTIIIAIIDL